MLGFVASYERMIIYVKTSSTGVNSLPERHSIYRYSDIYTKISHTDGTSKNGFMKSQVMVQQTKWVYEVLSDGTTSQMGL